MSEGTAAPIYRLGGQFVQLTQEDSGRRYALHVNDHITLTLPETPTTGYEWQARVDPDLLRELENRFDGETTPRGAAGTRIITFEVAKPGIATLRCDRRRAWESDAAEQFQVYLDIQP